MAAAASGGVGIGHLLRKSMGALKAEIDSARDKTTEGLTICPTHDGVAVQAVMGFGHGITSKVTHGTELYDAIYDSVGHDVGLSQHVLNWFPQANDREARNREAAINAITDFAVRMTMHSRVESTSACLEITSNLNSYILDIQDDIDKMREIEKTLTASIENISNDPLSTDLYHFERIQIKMKFDRDTKYVIDKHKSKAKVDERTVRANQLKESVQDDLDNSPNDRSLRYSLETVDKDLQRFEREIKRLDSDIIKHFSACMGSSTIHAPSESISLSIPLNPSSDKGVTLIKNTISYVKTHIKDYAVIIPYLERVADECDDKTGLHFEPPTIHDGYKDINEVTRTLYAQQSLMLYNKYVEVFGKNLGIINSTQSRFPVGKDPIDSSDHRIAYPNDGVYLFFALICRHKPANSNHTGKLVDIINKSHEFFDGRNDYARIATAIKLKLVECNNSLIKLSWAYSGRKILDRIHSDPLYTALYDRYLRGGDRPEDCATKLDELLTEIARIAQGRKSIATREPRMHAHDAHMTHDAYDMEAHDAHDHEQWHEACEGDDSMWRRDDDEHEMYAHVATDDAVAQILEAGDEERGSDMEAMWGQARGREPYRTHHQGKGKGRSYSPHKRYPSAGPGASRVFGAKGKGKGQSFRPRAYAADDASRPDKGCCHAKGCKASGLRNTKTLCERCIGLGRRNGRLTMYDGREQRFNRPPPQAQAHDAHDLDEHDDEYAYDDEQGHEYEAHDEMDVTLEAHLAREAVRFNARKRPRSQPPPAQGARARTEAGHRAFLEQQLERTQGGRGSSTREHQQR